MDFTVFPVKPWTPEKISGMFIVPQPIRYEMKPQQGSVTTWYKTRGWPFLLWEIFNFSFVSLWKSYFLWQTNTSHLIPSVQKPNFWIDQKVSANCGNLQRYRFSSFLSYKNIRIKNHQSQPANMTFWTARETNTEKHCLWLAHFFLTLRRAG